WTRSRRWRGAEMKTADLARYAFGSVRAQRHRSLLTALGIAVGIVLLPDLSRRLQANDRDGSRDALSRAGEMSLALTLPAAVALVVIPLPIVSVMFERGATTAFDSSAIATAVAIYGLGLPAFVLQKVLQPLYFARADTRSPFRYALWAMAINAAIAIGLAPTLGWIAPAIGTTSAGWAMVWMLWHGSRALGDEARFDGRFWARLGRISLASVAMGAVLWGAVALAPLVYALPGWRYLALLALILSGMITYALAGQITGAFSLTDLRAILRRNRS
ncbi:MAG: murein biosynthesis integral membrane protein MurJ, partial [Paracoccaceae bacterium]